MEGIPQQKPEAPQAPEEGKAETLGRINAEMAPILQELSRLTLERRNRSGPELIEIDEKEAQAIERLQPLLEKYKKYQGASGA